MSVTAQDCTPTFAETFTASPRRSFGLFTRVSLAFAAWHQRRQLAGLDATRLKDLGLSHMDAKAEAARSIWDVPAGWRS